LIVSQGKDTSSFSKSQWTFNTERIEDKRIQNKKGTVIKSK